MEEARAGSEIALRAYVWPLTKMASFKYLIRLLTDTDNDWMSVVANIRKARRKWGSMSQILGWKGADS